MVLCKNVMFYYCKMFTHKVITYYFYHFKLISKFDLLNIDFFGR